MKITVWTQSDFPTCKAKCVFMGETDILPRVGEEVCVREGLCFETLERVIIDLVKSRAEITIRFKDRNNDYGDCLYVKHLGENEEE